MCDVFQNNWCGKGMKNSKEYQLKITMRMIIKETLMSSRDIGNHSGTVADMK